MLTVRTKPPRRRNKAASSPLATALAYLTGVVIIIVTIVPLLYIFVGGFRSTPQINSDPTGLPHPWLLSNYPLHHHVAVFWQFLLNSALIAITATVLAVSLGVHGGFRPLAVHLQGSRGGLLVLYDWAAVPTHRRVAAALSAVTRSRVLENMFGVAMPEAAFSLSITIVILRPFMRAIPAELEDAAVIDGTTKLGFFWRVLLPLSMPALTTVSILAFVTSWNYFILPLLVFNNEIHFTLPLGVATLPVAVLR